MVLKKYINDLLKLDCNWYLFLNLDLAKKIHDEERSPY